MTSPVSRYERGGNLVGAVEIRDREIERVRERQRDREERNNVLLLPGDRKRNWDKISELFVKGRDCS